MNERLQQLSSSISSWAAAWQQQPGSGAKNSFQE